MYATIGSHYSRSMYSLTPAKGRTDAVPKLATAPMQSRTFATRQVSPYDTAPPETPANFMDVTEEGGRQLQPPHSRVLMRYYSYSYNTAHYSYCCSGAQIPPTPTRTRCRPGGPADLHAVTSRHHAVHD